MATTLRMLPLVSDLPSAPSRPSSTTPARLPGSVRRTAHLNSTFPEGYGEPMLIEASCRDLVTPLSGDPIVADAATMTVVVGADRTLLSISTTPEVPELQALLGHSGGSGFRRLAAQTVPAEMDRGTPVYFLLDDMPGVTLVGPSAWTHWPIPPTTPMRRPAYDMADICAGWRSDGPPYAEMKQGVKWFNNEPPVPEVADPTDPLGWHDLGTPPGDGPMFRRRRRIDVSTSPEGYVVDSLFRDAKWAPDGAQIGIHEYLLHAVVDATTLQITSISADPRVLPFGTCPAAASNVDLLLGEPMSTLRSRVLQLIRSTDCCTHLNDALRALAEVPVLINELNTANDV